MEKQKNLQLNIAWLYPKQMSTYGDRGNVLTLWQRAAWRGINVTLREINMGERIDPTRFDIYFFGGGQDQSQYLVADDIKVNKQTDFRKAARLGSVFLGICGGYQLLGNYYRPFNDREIPGIGLLDIATVAGKKRMIGNILIEANSDLGLSNYQLVGFENHSGKTYIGKKAKSLGTVIVGSGNNSEDRTEGAYSGNIFGCYLHGPLLPKNPKFADLLIQKALKRRWGDIELAPLDDSTETICHDMSIDRTKKLAKSN